MSDPWSTCDVTPYLVACTPGEIERIFYPLTGEYAHAHVLTYSFVKPGLDQTSALAYTPAAAYGGIIKNPRPRRHDTSGQWYYEWDEEVRDPAVGADPPYYPGEGYFGDTDP